jgi:hypothetical protein
MPTLTITATNQQAARLAAAIGRYLGLTDQDGTIRSATLEETQEFMVDVLKNFVIRNEREKKRAELADTAW